jgi:alpha-amylase/alpha-mannosidase (GH57 family)
MKNYICVHGHFYQPPRENAWLEEIELQESAAPYKNWNDRITNECYHPNAVSRILNDSGRIVDIVNNYAKMSFNFGPTLLSYLEARHPGTYQKILDADKQSLEFFDGHGSAIAQVYNHIIMPLATRRDKETQVKWGIYDFEKRFGRKPEGMWLAETAVDLETLEVLEENGISFTILAPNQARRFKHLNDDAWTDGIDSRRPYMCKLPNGKTITLFFYDGDRSQGVAFKGYLNDGKRFAEELLSGFEIGSQEAQLVHIATDGESYGHHHEHGDMALAYCMRFIENSGIAKVTNYSQFLNLVPVSYEVEIHENSSWSCAHGVERWKSNCGCQTGGEPDWTQEWRAPLRNALNWLKGHFDQIFEREMLGYHNEPWALRNGYVKVLFNRSEENKSAFFDHFFPGKLSPAKKTRITRLLELQKHAMYMFTSCGWFFTELSGIETIQVLQYANRGIQLIESETDENLNEQFKDQLADAVSNIPEMGNGRTLYERFVEPKRLSLSQVGFHYAVNALFNDEDRALSVLNYECISEDLVRYKAGNSIMAIGRTRVKSRVTGSKRKLSFGILYIGNHHMIGSTGDYMLEPDFKKFVAETKLAFDSSNILHVNDIFLKNLKGPRFSFFDLYKEEQLKILEGVLSANTQTAMSSFKRIFERNYGLLNLMKGQRLVLPYLLKKNLEIVVEYEMEQIFIENNEPLNLKKLQEIVHEILKWEVALDKDKFNFLIGKKIYAMVRDYKPNTEDIHLIDNMYRGLHYIHEIGLKPDLNGLQTFIFYLVKENHLPEEVMRAATRLGHYVSIEFKP